MKSYCSSVHIMDFFLGKLMLLRGAKATTFLLNTSVVDAHYQTILYIYTRSPFRKICTIRMKHFHIKNQFHSSEVTFIPFRAASLTNAHL